MVEFLEPLLGQKAHTGTIDQLFTIPPEDHTEDTLTLYPAITPQTYSIVSHIVVTNSIKKDTTVKETNIRAVEYTTKTATENTTKKTGATAGNSSNLKKNLCDSTIYPENNYAFGIVFSH